MSRYSYPPDFSEECSSHNFCIIRNRKVSNEFGSIRTDYSGWGWGKGRVGVSDGEGIQVLVRLGVGENVALGRGVLDGRTAVPFADVGVEDKAEAPGVEQALKSKEIKKKRTYLYKNSLPPSEL